MKILQFIVYFTFILCVYGEGYDDKSKNVTDPTQFPYFVVFIFPTVKGKEMWFGAGACGCSLIHPQWVLTAGHCLPDDENLFEDFIRFKRDMLYMDYIFLNQTPTRQARQVIAFHRHQGYVNEEYTEVPRFRKTLLNDVGLIKAHVPFYLTDAVQTIRLSTTFVKCEYVISIYVYLTEKNNISYPSGGLAYTKLQVKSLNIRDTPKTVFYVVGGENYEIPVNVHEGNSGGPLVCANVHPPVQIGILSRGTKENDTVIQAAERVDYFLDFIRKYVPIDEHTKYLSKPKEKFRKASNSTRPIYRILCLHFLLCILYYL